MWINDHNKQIETKMKEKWKKNVIIELKIVDKLKAI